MADHLDGRVAIVTGGASGIGREIVTTLVEHGARVIVVDLSPDAGAQTVALAGGTAAARYYEADVADLHIDARRRRARPGHVGPLGHRLQ